MKVSLHKAAVKYLAKLNPDDRERFRVAFDDLEKEPPEGDITSLSGRHGEFRLRVGNYRALFRFKENFIFVTHIEPRGEVYTKKTKSRRG